MKKLLVAFLCVLLTVCFASCSNISDQKQVGKDYTESNSSFLESRAPYESESTETKDVDGFIKNTNEVSESTETAKIIKDTFSNSFDSVDITESNLNDENPDKIYLYISVDIPDVTEYNADLFIKTSADSLQDSCFENSNYEGISFTLNRIDAILTVSKDSKGELSSSFIPFGNDENLKNMLKLSYQKSAYFSDIDSMKNYERTLDALSDEYN